MSTVPANSYRTDDLALVTFLRCRGYNHAEMVKDGRTCHWVFPVNGSLLELVDEYFADEAYVEPRDFMRKVALVRKEMYAFLGVQAHRVSSDARS